jgi:DNA invertase Pin-like site-specific DNA recombinase
MYREYPTFQPDEILEYLRKSRSDDPTLSVEEVLAKHESLLRDWQERNLDANIPEGNVYREVVSGETINSRPEFKKLLKRIESPKIKAVLVVECARLGRPDLEEIGKLSKLFRYTETIIITPQRMFDLRDEYDREQFERELMRGNDYLEYTKKILTRGKELSLRAGWYINAVTPYGYERE